MLIIGSRTKRKNGSRNRSELYKKRKMQKMPRKTRIKLSLTRNIHLKKKFKTISQSKKILKWKKFLLSMIVLVMILLKTLSMNFDL